MAQVGGAQLSKSSNAKVIGLAIAGAVGGFLFGFDSSVVNGAVDSIQSDFKLSSTLVGFAVAVALIGCAFGAIVGGRIGDRFGRIPTMVVAAVLFFASAIGAALAADVGLLIVWRLIGGFGIGIASVVAPAYIAEISPSFLRGRLGSLQQLAITLGIFAALLSDNVLANVAGSASKELAWGLEAWRWMFLVGVIPAAIYGILALFLPESPRYRVLKGQDQKAKETFEKLWPGTDSASELAEMKKSVDDDKNGAKGTLRGTALGLKPIIWIGIILSVFQQFVGINVIFYYSTTLWRAVGFTEKDSFTVSTLTSVTNVVVTIVAILLIDKVGRRPILIVGSLGMTVSLAVMALSFSQAHHSGSTVSLPGAWGPVALVGANVFVICFGASWGPIIWVLLGEIFPNKIRGRALGVAAAAQWIANFIVTITFPPLSAFSLVVTYGLYALFALLSLFFVARFIPETKGVALEDSEDVFEAHRKQRAEHHEARQREHASSSR
jgi:SP family sugar:H+ symporter-like MFS transporter